MYAQHLLRVNISLGDSPKSGGSLVILEGQGDFPDLPIQALLTLCFGAGTCCSS